MAASAKATKVGASVTGVVVGVKGLAVGSALEKGSAAMDKGARVARLWLKGSTAPEKEHLLAGAARVSGAKKPTYALEKDFQHEVSAGIDGSETEKFLKTGCTDTCSGNRKIDVYHPATKQCIEVKFGADKRNPKYALEQIQKDLSLLKNGECESIKWVFGPGADGRVGPYKELREELQRYGVPYEVYTPAP